MYTVETELEFSCWICLLVHMKFKFSITVNDNEILQVLIKITRNLRTLKFMDTKKKYKTDLIAMSAFLLNLHSKCNYSYNNKMISIKKNEEFTKVPTPLSWIQNTLKYHRSIVCPTSFIS